MSKPKNQQIIDSYDYLGAACSSTDCTGLIPAGVLDREELRSYEEIYPYRPPHIFTDPPKINDDDLLPL